MPRLRVIVALGQRQQAYSLDAPRLSLGRHPDSDLVLSLPFVHETHLLLEDGPDTDQGPTTLLRPAAPGLPLLLAGSPVPADGVLLLSTTSFDLEIPPPPDSPPNSPRLVLSVSPEAVPTSAAGVVNAPPPPAASPIPARRPPDGHRSPSVILPAALVLLASIVVSVVIFSRATPGPAPATPAPPPATPPSPDANALLNLAASRYLANDLPAAREALAAAAAAGATGPLPEALAAAIRQSTPPTPSTLPAAQPTTTPATTDSPAPNTPLSPPTTSTATPTTAPLPVPTSPLSPDPAAEAARRADAEARAQTDAQLRQALQQAERDAAAGIDFKQNPLGQAALAAAKSHVTARLAPAQLTFPDNADTRIVVVYDKGTLTVRGFVEQWNQNKQPLRLFYLTRLRPTGLDTFEHLGTDILQ